MLNGACHCGTVKISYDGTPKAVVHCNCSICRKLGVAWGHGAEGVISVDAPAEATIAYVWGSQELAFHSCRTCGCTTHWVALTEGGPYKMAMNMHLVESQALDGIPVRTFDGADTWTFLD